MTHTKDEAIKLALEEIKELVNQYVQIPKHHSSAKTLTILEQALAAPVQPCNLAEDGVCEALECCEQPAPVQEPVACEEQHPNNRLLFKRLCAAAGIELGKDNIASALDKVIAIKQALAQPAVPLTDEQIDEIVNRLDPLFLDVPQGFTTDFVRAIEAKLKEKNT
jgi:hypothetical protein